MKKALWAIMALSIAPASLALAAPGTDIKLRAGIYVPIAGYYSDCALEVERSADGELVVLSWIPHPSTRRECLDEGYSSSLRRLDSESAVYQGRLKWHPETEWAVGRTQGTLSVMADGNFLMEQENCPRHTGVCNQGSKIKWIYSSPYRDIPTNKFYSGRYSEEEGLSRAQNCKLAAKSARREALESCQDYRGGIYRSCEVISETSRENDPYYDTSYLCTVDVMVLGR